MWRFKLGKFDCIVLYDGTRTIGSMTNGSATKFIFGDAPEDELDKCLRAYGGFDSSTTLPFNYLLMKGGGHNTLIDTGCGDQAENDKNTNEPAGLLIKSLGEAGLCADDIDTVIVSHGHWDHFGGAVVGGRVAFPNAKYVISEKEAGFIRNNKGWALDYMQILGDRLSLVQDEAEINPGITVKTAPGHAPGITITEASSNGKTLIYTSDIIIHQAHVEHTDWIPSFETDRLTAIENRSKLVEEANKRNLLLFVPHIPNVIGRVARDSFGYKWVNEKI